MKSVKFFIVAMSVVAVLFTAILFIFENKGAGPENVYKVNGQALTVFDKPFGKELEVIGANEYVYVKRVEGNWAIKTMGRKKGEGYMSLSHLHPLDNADFEAFMKDSFPSDSRSYLTQATVRNVNKNRANTKIIDGWRAGPRAIFFFWIPVMAFVFLLVFFHSSFFGSESMPDFCIRASAFTMYLLVAFILWYVLTLDGNPAWFLIDQPFKYIAPSFLSLVFAMFIVLIVFHKTLENMAAVNGVKYKWRYTGYGILLMFSVMPIIYFVLCSLLPKEFMTGPVGVAFMVLLMVGSILGPQCYYFMKGSRKVYAIIPFYIVGLVVSTVSIIGIGMIVLAFVVFKIVSSFYFSNALAKPSKPTCGFYKGGLCSYAGNTMCPKKYNVNENCPYGQTS